MKFPSGKLLLLPLAASLVAAVLIHYAISAYVRHQAKEEIENILLNNRGFHQYIQQEMHPAFFAAMEQGQVAKDFYNPILLSSSYIVRMMHQLCNEERSSIGLAPIYYKMAANNPRNPVNRADAAEARLIGMFNDHPEIKEYEETVRVDGTTFLYYAIPFLQNEPRCLRCHGDPADAPVGLRQRYPAGGGFHERVGEVRAIESIRIPIEHATYEALMVAGSVGAGVFALVMLFLFNTGLRQKVRDRTRNLEAEVTERAKVLERLRSSENMLQAIIEAEPECVKLLDEQANLIMMNQAGLAMLQVDSLDQVKGKCVCPMIGSDHIGPFMDLTRRVFQGESGILLFEMIGIKGRRLWLETHAVPFRDEAGKITALLGVTRDVTERRLAKNALAEEKERLAVTLRSIGDGVIVTDMTGNITLVNKIAEQLTGWHQEEAAGQPLAAVFNIINETSREKCENPVERVLATGLIVGLANHTALIRKDGSEIIIADSAAPIRDRESHTIGVVLVFRDITSQYRMEQELQKMAKLESLGVLAGGLAHDFNNLLTSIIGNLSLSKMQVGVDHKSFPRLTEAEKAAQRATDLTYQLLTFARGGSPIKKIASITEIVKEAVHFALSGSSVKCLYSIPPALWSTEVDKGQMNQVFNNLIINAIHAMPEGGAVHIDFENVTLAAEEVPGLRHGDYLRITFRDEGTGIAENDLKRIFEPYFTTKKTGTGLGLATVFSILKRHEGHIAVESRPGLGTTFVIHIPAIRDTVNPGYQEKIGVRPGRGRILIMDDEPLIRNVASGILTALGYEADLAADGEEALEIYRQAGEKGKPFAAVVMDLTVPGGMGGKEAVKRLLDIDPAARVVVSSGYSMDPIMADFRKYGFKGVITKPYDTNQISDVIARVLQPEEVTSQ